MLFSGIPFLYYFLPITLFVYFIVPGKLKNAVLFLASAIFYAWGEQKLVLLFIASIVFAWAIGLLIEKSEKFTAKRILLTMSVSVQLALLAYFKYADFFISNLNAAFHADIPLLKIALPIGISFYTFQMMSYTIDVYRQNVAAQKNLINFAAYVSFFPQLIAGPIVRYSDISAQLTGRTHSLDQVASGIRRFILGLGKKILIANSIGAICTYYRAGTDPSVLYHWMYAAAYMLQIYFDFSAYSDMAIGLGHIFGFDFPENFNYPYISSSITEFWRRWHISLGSWFRDYVYIPLGGNRCIISRQFLNILVVWALTGLWHGASWNFVLWGLYFAFLLTVEKLFFKKLSAKSDSIRLGSFLSHIYVLSAVMIGFILFNADSIGMGIRDICGMFAFGSLPLTSVESLYYLRSYAVIFIIGIIGATPYPKELYLKFTSPLKNNVVFSMVENLFLILLLSVCTAYLVDGSFNPFLYFRF